MAALPDELLGGILRRVWADRPPRPARKEVRGAADLASVCRRWRELLRAPPLPLALDFSARCLSGAQRRWLLEPAQAGRVEAARLHSRDAMWEQPLFEDFEFRHGGALLQLSGVPLRLVASVSQEADPDLDLSGLRLTKLGVDCCDIRDLCRLDDGSWAAYLWLEPECLPGTLEELELLGFYGGWLGSLAWAPCVGAGSVGRLPRLQTLRVTTRKNKDNALETDTIPLLQGFPGLPCFEVDESHGDGLHLEVGLFGQVRRVRIVAGGYLALWDDQEDVAVFVDRLCHAGLQAAELCGKREVDLVGPHECSVAHDVVRDMISRYGDRFAVDVGSAGKPRDGRSCDKEELHRLAWRRWPAPGAPDLQAAKAAHEYARAWAAEICSERAASLATSSGSLSALA